MAEISFGRLGYIDEDGKFVPKNVRAQDVIASNGVSAESHITDTAAHLSTEQAEKIEGAVQSSALGAVDGVATLDANGKLAVNQIPEQLLGKVAYKGTFDPTTGLDDSGNELPAPAKGNLGWYWIASADGKYTPPGSTEEIDFTVGDWVISNGTKYGEVDNSTADPVARKTAEEAKAAAEAAQEAVGNAFLDAVHVSSEDELETLNLRPGALVLMDVSNDTPLTGENT